MFYIHGGMSYIRAQIHNFDSVVATTASENGGDGSTEISIKKDPTVTAWVPSAKLGLSLRTVGYAIRALMDRYGVENRFQLGLLLGASGTWANKTDDHQERA